MIQLIFTGLAHESYFQSEENKADLRNELRNDLNKASTDGVLIFNHFTLTDGENESKVKVFSVVADLVEKNETEYMVGGVSDNSNEGFTTNYSTLNIYRIENPSKDYDIYTSMIVVSSNESIARLYRPGGNNPCDNHQWSNPSDLKITLVGIALDTQKEGDIIGSSYREG